MHCVVCWAGAGEGRAGLGEWGSRGAGVCPSRAAHAYLCLLAWLGDGTGEGAQFGMMVVVVVRPAAALLARGGGACCCAPFEPLARAMHVLGRLRSSVVDAARCPRVACVACVGVVVWVGGGGVGEERGQQARHTHTKKRGKEKTKQTIQANKTNNTTQIPHDTSDYFLRASSRTPAARQHDGRRNRALHKYHPQ